MNARRFPRRGDIMVTRTWNIPLERIFMPLFSVCIPAAFANCPGEGRVLTSSTGVIKSNYDGWATYSNNERCKWVVKVQGAYAYDLEMKTFNIPDRTDFLQIDTCPAVGWAAVDSVDDCDASGDRLTGRTLGWQFDSYVASRVRLSTAVPLVFYFHSDAADVGQGFELTYSARSCPGSGTTITSAVGSLTDGPGNYGEYAYCKWTINLEGRSTNVIRFQFTELDIARGASVLIEECQPSQYTLDGTECSELWKEEGTDAIPPPVLSSATIFEITFSARNQYDQYPGFNLQYAPICASGYFSSAQGCTACSTDVCPAGQLRSSCQAIADSFCKPCSQSLPANASWTSGCEWTCNSDFFEVDGTCVPCTMCGDTETEAQVCHGYTDRMCKPCSVCSDNEYEVQPCTRSSDRSCASCKTCTSAEFEFSPCTGFEDRQCEACDRTSQCQPNQILVGCGSGERGSCECDAGWTSSDNLTCTDINECARGSHDCDTSQTVCTNIDGGFECTCDPGYSWNGVTCLEIDYCLSNPCHVQASCMDEAPPSASGICTCNVGYSGNGITCEDSDECRADTHTCDPNARCTNTVGSFTCGCNAGYAGSGKSCSDVDECSSASDNNCDVSSVCSNTRGSFTCTCDAGWSGDGVQCFGAVAMVRMTVQMLSTVENFDMPSVRVRFKQACATAASASVDKVKINNVRPVALPLRRVLLQTHGIEVNFGIETESKTAASRLIESGSLSLENLNAELNKWGVDPIMAIKSAPAIQLISDDPTSDPYEDEDPVSLPADDKDPGRGGGGSAAFRRTAAIVITVVGGLAVLVIMFVAGFVFWHRRKQQPQEESQWTSEPQQSDASGPPPVNNNESMSGASSPPCGAVPNPGMYPDLAPHPSPEKTEPNADLAEVHVTDSEDDASDKA